jgi:cytochrome c oxidase assembly protein subunit 15
MKKLESKNKQVIWLLSGCVLIFVMVIIGGITRLTHSGLSMVEWNLVMGSLPPMNAADWQEVFDKYKQFPEYEQVNFHFSLEEFKSIFWWEYWHRFLGRLIGVVFVFPFVYFLLKRTLSKVLTKKLIVLLFLGGLQGFLGWFMVESGLKSNPDVSHYRLALHLITAFITFAFTLWLALEIHFEEQLKERATLKLKKYVFLFLGLLLLQIIYGAFVAGLNAGFIFNTYPKMGDDWIAPAATVLSPFYLNLVENIAGVQLVHRYLPLLLVLILILLWRMAIRQKVGKARMRSVYWLGAALLIQFTLGVLTLLMAVPVYMGVLHQSAALILLATTVYTLFSFTGRKKKEVTSI